MMAENPSWYNTRLVTQCQRALPDNTFSTASTELLAMLRGQPSLSHSWRENPYWHVADSAIRRVSDRPVELTENHVSCMAIALNATASCTGIASPDLLALTGWKALVRAVEAYPRERLLAVVRVAAVTSARTASSSRLKTLYADLMREPLNSPFR